MSKINEKLGLKPAGVRPMMRNLPKRLEDRVALTAATCPACGARGVIENVIHGKRRRLCAWCSEGWDA
jgi:hypothetical protein